MMDGGQWGIISTFVWIAGLARCRCNDYLSGGSSVVLHTVSSSLRTIYTQVSDPAHLLTFIHLLLLFIIRLVAPGPETLSIRKAKERA